MKKSNDGSIPREMIPKPKQRRVKLHTPPGPQALAALALIKDYGGKATAQQIYNDEAFKPHKKTLGSLARHLGLLGLHGLVKLHGKTYTMTNKALLPPPVVNMADADARKAARTEYNRMYRQRKREEKVQRIATAIDRVAAHGNRSGIAGNVMGARNLAIEVKAGSEMSFSVGDVRITVRAV